MRPRDQEPVQNEFEKVIEDEERDIIKKPDVPDDVKSEIYERLERIEESDRESAGDGP
jgi:hypothetical protein